jgi:hypothetical protein
MDDIYGATGRNPDLIAAFAAALNELWTRGTKAVLADFLS